MVECAELLVDTVATADWAYFMKNGTDATTFAMLCARAYTRRKKIIFFKGYYHGNDPWAMKADYPGILPEDRGKVFDRFFTADRAHTAGKGTGLGLSICKRIMEFHGQSLRLLDTAEGTAFAFTLEKAKNEDTRKQE